MSMELFEGIAESDKLCPECGQKLRLHMHQFTNCKEPTWKSYTDCKNCGYVTDWEPVQIEATV